MNSQYVTPLPQDASNMPMQEFPSPKKALQVAALENATASSVVGFTHDTTSLEVVTLGTGAAIRWVPSSVLLGAGNASVATAISGANYDHVIPPNVVRRFVIPRETQGNPQSIQGVNRANGLYQRLAVRTLGIASVFLSEY